MLKFLICCKSGLTMPHNPVNFTGIVGKLYLHIDAICYMA